MIPEATRSVSNGIAVAAEFASRMLRRRKMVSRAKAVWLWAVAAAICEAFNVLVRVGCGLKRCFGFVRWFVSSVRCGCGGFLYVLSSEGVPGNAREGRP